jgi:hypothetical protein
MKEGFLEEEVSNIVALLVVCIAVFTFIIIPLRVTAYGYLPPDDALRHAAKVISGKDWSDILVLRPEIKMDSHPGWHAFLSLVHKITGCDQDGLVVFSVVFLFILFCLVPIFFLEYPESWLSTLLITNLVNTYFIWRLLCGRPFVLTVALVLVLCFLWPRLSVKKFPRKTMLLLTVLVALSTWIHGGTWYLLILLPAGCLFLARQRLAGIRYCICAFTGVILGAAFTGHPYLFLQQTLTQALLAFSGHPLQRMLVAELRGFTGDPVTGIIVSFMLLWRALRGAWDTKRINNPVFMLMIAGWILGFAVWRFWLDWGMAAFLVWMAQELDDVFRHTINPSSWRRIAAASIIALPLYLSVTGDKDNRCTWNLNLQYLSQDDPKLAGWLPGLGGIIYSNDMGIFYQTFFNNPRAPWRYILGFEPTWMPPEDLVVFRKIQWNNGAGESFQPWVEKIRPQDRMIVRSPGGAPAIEGLQWHYAVSDIWIGKKGR